MVYVISKDGKILDPTNRHGMVRHLLKQGLVRVIQRDPFTIQLLYDTTTYTPQINNNQSIVESFNYPPPIEVGDCGDTISVE